jgi:hypothetical protein
MLKCEWIFEKKNGKKLRLIFDEMEIEEYEY